MSESGRRVRVLVCTGVFAISASAVRAQVPLRDLSDYSGPSTTFVVEITLNAPPGAAAVGMEDAPPANWSVANISDSGTWDALTLSVKWGPFFDPGIPTVVSYEVIPTGNGSVSCFDGTVSFDGVDATIGGDDCIGDPVPAASLWGLMLMVLLLLVAATIVVQRKARRGGCPH